ncbi:hypothetical protein LOCC1_G007401 [Lachnellula occidentalis]|uniref:Uncharacterized protein n=1 Tax=Lachnellula occidentalis TaxID=215460 RepID=A0A8H8RHB4_9HELO|nr:hypothetical protein LOCC1_G007401 [Lachnellula occidentalis]
MEDAIRPNNHALRAMYERGYRTWSSLYEVAVADIHSHIPWWDCLQQLETAFPNHPSFPSDLVVDTECLRGGPRTILAIYRSFEQNFLIQVASDTPVVLDISDAQPRWFEEEDDHVAILILAWTYVLSARWAEVIPGACVPVYTNNEAKWDVSKSESPMGSSADIIDLGDVDDAAARWWTAVLAVDGGWNTTLLNDRGGILYSPWYTKLVSSQHFVLSSRSKSHYSSGSCPVASFTAALRYLTSYCEYHNVSTQSHSALAAALLLPVARWDNTKVQISSPRFRQKAEGQKKIACKTLAWIHNLDQLDKLLTLSCNALGTKALLGSVFFEPGVECNICGAWLQGTFAFLDSNIMKDQQLLLRVLMKRDPSLGFLWLGSFITGAHKRSLQQGRQAWWKLELNTAAWTGTLISFIQEPVSAIPSEAGEISRADEARLLYLCRDQPYTGPPLFSWPPFGSTALTDTNLDVLQHAQCNANHGLEYETLIWQCRDDKRTTAVIPHLPYRTKNGNPTNSNISVDYDNLDQEEEDENSEMVTRNIFTWLREEGFPVAERGIREHEWIDNLDESDDGDPITGDTRSSVRVNLHGWLMKTSTTRCNSL